MKFYAVILLVSLSLSACVSKATTAHVETQAAAHDGACRLIAATLAGEAGVDSVSAGDLAATPASVRKLLDRMTRFVFNARRSWHTLRFTLDNGPDPNTLDLGEPPAIAPGESR